jgi:hypothetical protein
VCEVFNEAVPMYPEAVIKALFPKHFCDYMVEIANKVSFIFDGRPDARKQSHEPRRALRPLAHGLRETSDEKRGTPKTQGARVKRPPMKKETPLKCKGLNLKDLQ